MTQSTERRLVTSQEMEVEDSPWAGGLLQGIERLPTEMAIGNQARAFKSLVPTTGREGR
jgi:predicted TIM-barrel enzyme